MTTEVELARPVVAWLESEGWTVYQEVAHEGRIADIVGVRGPLTVIVEAKKHRAATVMDQARKWKGEANQLWVAVPKTKNKAPGWWDVELHLGGMGEFTVDAEGEVEIRRSPVHHRMEDLGIRSALNEGQKDFAEAGNADGSRWSPFAVTARALRHAVETQPGMSVDDFVAAFGHNYANDQIAVACIKRSLQQGAIKGLVYRSGKVWPEKFDRHKFKQEES